MTKLRVNEIFGPSFQGEGSHVGRKVMFVRLAGCDYRCSWCDTKRAQRAQDGEPMTPQAVLDQVIQLGTYPPDAPVDVVLTGGNPLIQPAVEELLELSPANWHFHVETQGSVWQDWVNHPKVLCITVSPKLPNSGVEQDPQTVTDFLLKTRLHRARTVLKIVIFHAVDVQAAIELYQHVAPLVSDWVFSVGTMPDDGPEDLRERWEFLTNVVMGHSRLGSVRILPQLHVLLWGHIEGV